MLTLPEGKQRIDTALAEVYATFRVQAEQIDPHYAELLSEMSIFAARGGKRLRPYLAYLLYVGLGGTNEKVITDVGVVLELFHQFLLIHDDIIDKDVTRYGGANLSGVYAERLRDPQTGHAVALIAGDITLGMALTIAQNVDASEQIVQWMNRALFTVCGGEFSDSFTGQLQRKKAFTAEQNLLLIYINKTALYSFDFPMQIGALLAGRSDLSSAILAVAVPLGVAYQLHDDYLGCFGDEKMTGKSTMGDMREGKQTYLYALTQKLAYSHEKKMMHELYGRPGITEWEAEYIRAVMIGCSAAYQTKRVMQQYAALAEQKLKKLPITPEVAAALSAFIRQSLAL